MDKHIKATIRLLIIATIATTMFMHMSSYDSTTHKGACTSSEPPVNGSIKQQHVEQLSRKEQNFTETAERPVAESLIGPPSTNCRTKTPCVYPEEVDLRLIVMTFNRAKSLTIVLDSLLKLDAMGDVIALDIWIDRNKKNVVDTSTLKAAQRFQWSKGPFRVHVQSEHVGLYGQWIDTWRPRENTTELALFLEDDLVISPHTWRWLKAVHAHYGKDAHNSGYPLNCEQVETAGVTMRKHVDGGKDSVFYFERMGTWGFAPHPKVWRAFQDWYHSKITDPNFRPYVNDLVLTSWYKKFEKRGTQDGMWSMWFTYYINERNLYVLHDNINAMTSSEDKCLAVHREEPGLHYFSKAKTNGQKNLLVNWTDEYIHFPQKPKLISFFGKLQSTPS